MARAAIGSGWAVILLLAIVDTLPAQQVTVSTPLIGVQDNFYEHFNIGWSFRSRSPRSSMFFNFGSPAIPPFGGFNPNADARIGIAQQWGDPVFGLGIRAGTGRTATMTMTAPMITMMNGVPGSIQDVTMRPFVTGLIPVVGAYAMYPTMPVYTAPPMTRISPLAERLGRLQYEKSHGVGTRAPQDGELALGNDGDDEAISLAPANPIRASTAERGDVSVAEIRRRQAAEQSAQEQEIERLIAEARDAEAAGQLGIARVRYQQAAAKADGERRRELLASAARLKGK